MKVLDLMTSDVLYVAPETKVDVVARMLADNSLTGVPVVDGGGRVVGVVTESDLIVRNAELHFPTFLQILDARIYLQSPKHFEEELRRMLATTAAEVMSTPAITVSPEDSLEHAATLMVDKGANPLPVLEGSKLVGIISRSDVVRLMVHDDQAAQG